jgi:hypothetical protein
MKRIGLAVLFLSIVACSAKEEQPPYPVNFNDEGAGLQTRLGSYVQQSIVTPKMRACWAELPGQGAFAMDLNYHKDGDRWVFDKAAVTKSSLEKGHETLAQRCVDDAAQTTSFPFDAKDGLEAAAPQMVVRLGWSVPLPAEGTQMTNEQMTRMVGGGGSSGVITVPGCSACVSRKEYPYGLKCESRKSGSDKDCEEINSNTCATTPTACVRGVFGGTRGVIMY